MHRRRLVPALALSTALTASLLVTAASPAAGATPQETYPLVAGSLPEGIAAGPGSTVYAGARRDGAVYALDVLTGDRRLFAGPEGRQAVGLEYDGERVVVAGGSSGFVTAYGPTGAMLFEVASPLDGGVFLNDVAIADDGTAYVTDSFNPSLVVVQPGGTATRLPLGGDFGQPAGFGANGIQVLPDGDLVLVSAGTLYRVDPQTGEADALSLRGRQLTGGDGLELVGDTLYVTYAFGRDKAGNDPGDSIAVVRLDDDVKDARVVDVLRDEDLDRPTTSAFLGGALYTVNGRFEQGDDPALTYDVVRVTL